MDPQWPCQANRRYAVRLTGSCAKSSRLLERPVQIAEPLMGICFDGIHLGARELSLTADALKAHPTMYWNMLGDRRLLRWLNANYREVHCSVHYKLSDIRKHDKDEKRNLVLHPMKIVHADQPRRSSSRLYDNDDDLDNE